MIEMPAFVDLDMFQSAQIQEVTLADRSGQPCVHVSWGGRRIESYLFLGLHEAQDFAGMLAKQFFGTLPVEGVGV